MNCDAKIYVAGHSGLVGAQLLQKLAECGYTRVIVRTHRELDLTRQEDVEAFFAKERPEYVFLAAARTGGVPIRLDTPVEMFLDNALITLNVLRAALQYDVKKLLYIASGLVYPGSAPQPLRIESIGIQGLGAANEPYALAKIAGIRLCQYIRKQYRRSFISCIPCNTYGAVKQEDSQFIPATIRKFAENPEEIVVWGDGTATREFLHGDDLADALVFLMERYDADDPVNVGTDEERSVAEVVEMLRRISGYAGKIRYDAEKPNGVQRLFMDSSALRALGWRPKRSLEDGLRMEFERYRDSQIASNIHR